MVKKRYSLSNIRLPFDTDPAEVKIEATKQLGLAPASLEDFKIDKKSVDCRNRRILFVYSVSFDCDTKLRPSAKAITQIDEPLGKNYVAPSVLECKPIVIGTGPAGIFAALELTERGFAPVILEQGGDMATRHKVVSEFLESAKHSDVDNMYFGEGGAGTYSDGKLTGRSAGDNARKVLSCFHRYGADESILIDAYPHIGSDKLRAIMPQIRQYLESQGCEFHFHTKVKELTYSEGNYVLETTGGTFSSRVVIFGCGQNSLANYWIFRKAGIPVEMKPFQMGVRLEFPQQIIEERTYGEHAFDPRLPRAKVNLVFHDKNRGLSVHSFCNCPGGVVVPAPETGKSLCVNGMSNFMQDGEFCNTALVTTFHGVDLGAETPMDLLDKRAGFEEKAFEAGGGNFAAPAMKVQDLIARRQPSKLPSSSYPLGLTPVDLYQILPSYFLSTLRAGLGSFEKKLPGITGPASLLIAPETRASSPVRVPRDENMQIPEFPYLFVVGEGSGYAGGIMSSAIDGIKAALVVAKEYRPAD